MRPNLKASVLFDFLFNSIVFTSCIWYLQIYARLYFEYGTLFKSAPYVPVDIKMPRLSLCFSYLPLLNPSIESIFYDDIDKNDARTQEIINMTVAQLFDVTPDSKQMINSCSYRPNYREKMIESFDKAECVRRFNITKYFTQGYVCYMFNPDDFDEDIDFSLVSTHLDSRRILFDISIAPPLSNGLKVLPLIHYHEKAYFDMIFNMDLLPSLNMSETFVLSYDMYQMDLLPAPYNTSCIEGIETASLCRVKCMNAQFASDNLLYGAAFVFERSERSFLVSDFDSSLMKKERDSSIECSSRCRSNICHDSFTRTYFSQPFASTKKLNFIIEAPSGYTYRLLKIPAIELNVFILDSATYLSVGLGLSVLGISSLFTSMKQFMRAAKLPISRTTDCSLGHLRERFKRVKQFHHRIRRTINHLRLVNNTSRARASRPKQSVKRKARGPLKVVAVVVQVIIFTTLAAELALMVTHYMRYEVRLDYYLDVMDIKMEIPTIVICTPILNLFNIKIPVYHELDQLDAKQMVLDSITNHSIEQLFERTLTPQDFVKACRFRKADYYQLVYYNSSELCGEKMEMTKFYMNQQICYKLKPLGKLTNKRVEFYRQTMDTPGVIYSIIPAIKTEEYQELEVILFYDSSKLDYPSYSREYSYNVMLQSDQNQLYLVSYIVSQFDILEWPYTTDCRNTKKSNSSYSNCLIEKMANEMNILPNSVILMRHNFWTLPVVSYSDMRDEIVSDKLERITQACRKYDRRPCGMSITKTTISYPMRSNEQLELAVSIPMNPKINSRANPLYDFESIVRRCTCAISFWLGLNLMALNPLSIYLYFARLNETIQFEKICRKMENQLDLIKTWTYHMLNEFGKRIRKIKEVQRSVSIRSNEMKIISMICCNLFKFICLVGCVTQIVFISSEFFRFPTDMNTELDRDGEYSMSRLSVCPRLDQLIFKEPNVPGLLNLTIGEMLDQAPPTEQVVSACGARSWYGKSQVKLPKYLIDRLFIFHDGYSNCSQYFNFTRSIRQQFICYTSWLKNLSPVRRTEEFLFKPKLLFYLELNSSISTDDLVVSISNSMYQVDLYSPTICNGNTTGADHFVSYTKCIQNVLPLPYDNDGYTSPDHMECVDLCIEHLISQHNLTLFDMPHYEASDRKFIKYLDEENDLYFSTRRNCLKQCQSYKDKKDKYVTYVTTVNQLPSHQAKENRLSFYVFNTFMFVLNVQFRARVSPYEYYLQLGSVVSIWFGLSILDLNPFMWMLKRYYFVRKHKNNRERMHLLSESLNQIELAQGTLNTSLVMRMQTGII